MRDEVIVTVNVSQLAENAPLSALPITLTRAQVEKALEELNTTEPFRTGDIVRHKKYPSGELFTVVKGTVINALREYYGKNVIRPTDDVTMVAHTHGGTNTNNMANALEDFELVYRHSEAA